MIRRMEVILIVSALAVISFICESTAEAGEMFSDPVNYLAGERPCSVYAADLDGDGDVDLAVANNSSSDVSVLFNSGDGAFSDPTNYAVGTWPECVHGGDFDGDGDVDLVTANWLPGDISVLLNNGDGTFSPAISYPVGGRAVSVFGGDLDGDGDIDLAVAREDSSYVTVLFNNGDGSFPDLVNYPAGSGVHCGSAFCGDLDNDRDVDLVVASFGSNDVSVLLNLGDGTFSEATKYPVGRGPFGICGGDFDRDGYMDLAVANAPGHNIAVLLNSGNRSFAEAVYYSIEHEAHFVCPSDLDGDQDIDLVVAAWWEEGGNVEVLLNQGNGIFSEPVSYSAGTEPVSIYAADLDGDGDADLAVTNRKSNNVSILFNNPRITASIPNTSALPGASVTVPVNVDDASGIAGANLDIGYDAEVLTIGEITTSDLSEGMMLTVNTTEPGVARIALAGATGIAGGSGALVNLGFQVAESAVFGTVVPLRFAELDLRDEAGEEIGSQSIDGSLTVIGILGDLNGDGNVNSGDAILALRVSVGLLTPTPYQQWAGDVNEDGVINSGDAILILRKAVGLPSFKRIPLAKTLAGVDVSVSDTTGCPGEKIVVCISVSDATGIAGGDLTLTYDPDILTAQEVKGTVLAAGLLVVSNASTPGEVRISLAGAVGLSGGSGSLIEVTFDVREDTKAGATSPLRLTEITLRDETGNPLDLGTISKGTFTVGGVTSVEAQDAVNLPPSFALSQNYPNPFNAATSISYQLSERSFVKIRVYNPSGQVLRTLMEEEQPAGYHIARWDGKDSSGRDVASGIYLYRLQVRTGHGREDFTQTRRMILLR